MFTMRIGEVSRYGLRKNQEEFLDKLLSWNFVKQKQDIYDRFIALANRYGFSVRAINETSPCEDIEIYVTAIICGKTIVTIKFTDPLDMEAYISYMECLDFFDKLQARFEEEKLNQKQILGEAGKMYKDFCEWSQEQRKIFADGAPPTTAPRP